MFDFFGRRWKRHIEHLLIGLHTKLDRLETSFMTTTQDITARIAALTTSVAANTSATEAIKTYVEGLKAQLADIKQQLADAIAAGADPAALQVAVDNLDALTAAIDADAAAEAAIVNTPADPNA